MQSPARPTQTVQRRGSSKPAGRERETDAVFFIKMASEAEEKEHRSAVLSRPLSLDGGLAADLRAPKLIQGVLGLFRDIRPGSDLTHFQLPPLFNLPKSQLQSYGETVYCVGEDMLSRCAQGNSSLERFTSVVAWSLSTIRPLIFGLVPFNPVLGETHHVSNGALNVLLEQVSHHPPLSALHATDAMENIELIWCQNAVPKFYGTSIEAVIKGKRLLRLLSFGENYEIDSPNIVIKLLPLPATDWLGNVRIQCKESGFEADLCYYRSHSFLGFGRNSRLVKGKIFQSKSLKTIYEIDGQWDRTIALKDVHSGKTTVLYEAKEAISRLEAPIVKDSKGLWPTESAVVWSEVSHAILHRDWERARTAKRCIEERERRLKIERGSKGVVWVPKYFKLTNTNEGGWDCWPIEQSVPPAPIIVHPSEGI